jgi:hypothetical protein
MSTLTVLTKSYLPDIGGFERLHESVLRFTDPEVRHDVVVPGREVAAFEAVGRRLGSARLRVIAERELLPSSFVQTGMVARAVSRVGFLPAGARITAINRSRPWPPIRGWIMQQVIKLAAAAASETDVVVVIDSDVELIRPIDATTFMRDGVVRTYRRPGAITPDMVRHVEWSHTARRLLGVPDGSPPFDDYIAGLISWDPDIVRRSTARVQEVHGQPWQTSIAGLLHFSENILYGTYLTTLATQVERSFCEDDTLCHSYWGTAPLQMSDVDAFVAGLKPSDVAVHVQSASGTSDAVLSRLLQELRREG